MSEVCVRWTLSLFAIPYFTAFAQPAVPVRELGPVEAISTEPFKNVFGVRTLRDGQLLVNDGTRRQLIILNSRLELVRVLLDSAAVDGRSYGPRATTIIPFLGDSTLFVDGPGLSLLVIDPNGQFARVMAAPKARDLPILTYSRSGSDARGNLVYVGEKPMPKPLPARAGIPVVSAVTPDSAPLVRANFETRSVDTIGFINQPSTTFTNSVMDENRQMHSTKRINPMVTVDEWATLSDGSIAFVRGHDYHIDWLMPDGRKRSSAKLPFDWKRLTDKDKVALIDSARAAEEKLLADRKLAVKERERQTLDEKARGIVPSPDPTLEFVPLKEIADYYPALRRGAARADEDNNLWILPTTSAQSNAGELIYDVVNNRGELTHRVRVPANRSIAGFGHDGVIYLMFRDDAGRWHLERTRMRPVNKS